MSYIVDHPVEERYRELRAAADGEFRRNRKRYRRQMVCKSGCDACCYHPFSITEVEAARISAAVGKAPCPELRTRAAAYLEQRSALFARTGYIEARGNLPPAEARLACPALDEAGACRLYDERPLICRRVGAPMAHPTEPGRVFACEKNFRPGATLTDAKLVSIQFALAGSKDELEREFDRAGGRRYSEPITVAHAILADFRVYLPSEAIQPPPITTSPS